MGSQITDYAVVSATPQVRCRNVAPLTDRATSCVVAGLANGNAYTFTVRASANTNGPTNTVTGPTSTASGPLRPARDVRVHTAPG